MSSEISRDMLNLAEAVIRYADAHYGESGWDVIAECWSPEDVALYLEAHGITTVAEALSEFGGIASLQNEGRMNATF